MTVEATSLEEASEIVGRLEAARSVIVRAEAEGQVNQIFAAEGNFVAAGTPVAQLNFEKQRADVGGAIASVNSTISARENALAQLRTAEAERTSAQADLELSSTQLTRTTALVGQGALARQQLDQARRDRNADLAALRAASQRVQAAQATLRQTQAEVDRTRAEAVRSSATLQDTRVIAPIAGVVGTIPIKLGDYVKIGDTITTIIQNQTLTLNLSIPIERSPQLRIGLPVQLNSPDRKTLLSQGRVSFISPQVSGDSQSILAKAAFPNPDGNLRDGQTVLARVIWQKRPGVAVPTTAISRVAGQTFVFVAQQQDQKQIAKQKPVKLGSIQGNNYQVLEGLQPGEKIVTSGLLNLTDGAPIIPQ